MNDRLIFLTGYMASGKTTFGRALAARLAIPPTADGASASEREQLCSN